MEVQSENLKELKKIIDFYSNLSAANDNSSSLLNFLMDTISDSIWQWNVNTGSIKFSKNLQSVVDLKLDGQLENFFTVVHPNDLEKLKDKMLKFIVNNSGKNIFSQHKLFEHKYRVFRKDGTCIHVMDKAKIISWNTDGTPAIIVGINMSV